MSRLFHPSLHSHFADHRTSLVPFPFQNLFLRPRAHLYHPLRSRLPSRVQLGGDDGSFGRANRTLHPFGSFKVCQRECFLYLCSPCCLEDSTDLSLVFFFQDSSLVSSRNSKTSFSRSRRVDIGSRTRRHDRDRQTQQPRSGQRFFPCSRQVSCAPPFQVLRASLTTYFSPSGSNVNTSGSSPPSLSSIELSTPSLPVTTVYPSGASSSTYLTYACPQRPSRASSMQLERSKRNQTRSRSTTRPLDLLPLRRPSRRTRLELLHRHLG